MASNSKFTTERKAQMKKDVLAAIGVIESKPVATKKLVAKPDIAPMPRAMGVADVKSAVTNRSKPAFIRKKPIKPVKPKPAKKVTFSNVIPSKSEGTLKKAVFSIPTKELAPSGSRTGGAKRAEGERREGGGNNQKVIIKPKPITRAVMLKPAIVNVFPGQKTNCSKAIGSSRFPDPAKLNKIKKTSIFSHKLMFLSGAGIFMVATCVVFLAANLVGIYRFGWAGQTEEFLAQVLPLPAGKVNNQTIGLSEYFSDYRILKKSLAGSGDLDKSGEAEVRSKVFDRLAAIKVTTDELRSRYGKSVTAEMVDARMVEVEKQLASGDIAGEIKRLYGVGIGDFKEKIIKPIIIAEELQKQASQDTNLEIVKKAREQADEVLKLARQSGVDFSALAAQYNQDAATVDNAGDLGWVTTGELNGALEQKLFALNNGEILNEVVAGESGFHIFKVEQKLTNEETGKTSIKVRRILIGIDPAMYIKGLLDSAVIKFYLK